MKVKLSAKRKFRVSKVAEIETDTINVVSKNDNIKQKTFYVTVQIEDYNPISMLLFKGVTYDKWDKSDKQIEAAIKKQLTVDPK